MEFFAVFTDSVAELEAVEIVVCPPFTALAAAVEATRESAIAIAAQNVHEEESGAYTGEISLPMLSDLGVEGAVVGHSERRQLFGESDEALARKVPAILAAGLVPILCCGETEAERDGDETEAVLRRQLEADLAGVDHDRLGDVVIAYEPIWAIGTGKTASPGAGTASVRVRARSRRGDRCRRRGASSGSLRGFGQGRERSRAVLAGRYRWGAGRRGLAGGR